MLDVTRFLYLICLFFFLSAKHIVLLQDMFVNT